MEKLIELCGELINQLRSGRKKCEKLEDFSVVLMEKFEVNSMDDGWDTKYRLVLEILNKGSLKVLANFAMKSRMKNKEILPKEQHPFLYFKAANGIEVFLQVADIEFNNICGEGLCLCSD